MSVRSPRNKDIEYRDLPSHQERVRSFTMTCNNLVTQVRVQLELDVRAELPAQRIVERRIRTLEHTIRQIRHLLN